MSGSFTQWIIFKQSHVFLSCTSVNTVTLSLSHTVSVWTMNEANAHLIKHSWSVDQYDELTVDLHPYCLFISLSLSLSEESNLLACYCLDNALRLNVVSLVFSDFRRMHCLPRHTFHARNLSEK